MTVGQIMSKDGVFVKEDDFVTHARQMLRDYFLRSLPVIDGSERLVGILTDQDVLNITANKSHVTVAGYARECPLITPDMDAIKAARLLVEVGMHRVPVVASTSDRKLVGMLSDVDLLKKFKITRISPKMVKEIMETKVKTCNPNDSISKVWQNMLDQDFTGIPVVSEKNKPMGMITRMDIIKAGFARIGSSDAHGTKPNDSTKVEKLMSTPIYATLPETSISKAIEMVLHYDIGRLIIINDSKMMGIVGRHDLLKACLVGKTSE
ncbi:HPP family protein [Methanococcoides sp. NM1]|uniref:CBS domain-containing protein n=1 Tax=Methanococcoides sp. NM1 TaxID=1201013 RepID=UPI00108314A7|nr:CBS domain-containing protein [Methanococcoides sp. NM1]